MTLQEIKEWMARELDEESILDLLDINTYELVEYLEDVILDKVDDIEKEIATFNTGEEYE